MDDMLKNGDYSSKEKWNKYILDISKFENENKPMLFRDAFFKITNSKLAKWGKQYDSDSEDTRKEKEEVNTVVSLIDPRLDVAHTGSREHEPISYPFHVYYSLFALLMREEQLAEMHELETQEAPNLSLALQETYRVLSDALWRDAYSDYIKGDFSTALKKLINFCLFDVLEPGFLGEKYRTNCPMAQQPSPQHFDISAPESKRQFLINTSEYITKELLAKENYTDNQKRTEFMATLWALVVCPKDRGYEYYELGRRIPEDIQSDFFEHLVNGYETDKEKAKTLCQACLMYCLSRQTSRWPESLGDSEKTLLFSLLAQLLEYRNYFKYLMLHKFANLPSKLYDICSLNLDSNEKFNLILTIPFIIIKDSSLMLEKTTLGDISPIRYIFIQRFDSQDTISPVEVTYDTYEKFWSTFFDKNLDNEKRKEYVSSIRRLDDKKTFESYFPSICCEFGYGSPEQFWRSVEYQQTAKASKDDDNETVSESDLGDSEEYEEIWEEIEEIVEEEEEK